MTDAPSWTRDVIWWHLYPLGFTGAPIRPEHAVDAVAHRLERIEHWLDHVVELGLNGILLGPVFASSTHGYDTVDHLRIDPRLGDDADFDRLVAAAHDRGIRVLLDGVFNHVGREHPRFREVEAQGPDADAAALFAIDWPADWAPGDPVPAGTFEGHDALVTLDHAGDAAVDLVVEVMIHWLERGIDGWRLDAAYAAPPEFWARVLPRVRERFPEAWFSAEVIHGDYADLVARAGYDSVTQYELWQGIWHGIADRNLWELRHAIERHTALLRDFVPSTFVGNHDVTRIASAVGDDFVPHALAVLLTVGGVPSIWAGDELGMTGVKEERLGGDDAVRPEFPEWSSAPDGHAGDVLDLHRTLVGIRRRHAWLHRAATDVVTVTNTALVLRTATGDAAIVTALSLADEPVALPAAGATAVLAGSAELEAGQLTLPPRGWAVLGG